MITGTEIYWLTRMTYFHNGALAMGIIFAILGVIFVAISIGFWLEEEKSSMFKVAFPIFLFCILLIAGSLFIPTTKEMCAIKVLPAIINNEEVRELPNKVVDLANEWVEELKPKKEE